MVSTVSIERKPSDHNRLNTPVEPSQKEDGTGTKIAKLALFGSSNFTQFEGTIQVVDIKSSAVLYAYNVKKGNFQSAAEAFAKHFKGDYLEKRR